ncbi:MAG: helix-turn-helix domain-containing protein [Ruminococcus flavefaciens]|nr:helix-turn-helix domain-containing protein [Ruminococcus flavefaciens]
MKKSNEYIQEEQAWQKEFSETLKKLMERDKKDKNLSANKLASKIGIDSKSIYNYLSGQSTPTIITLMRLADHFGVDIDKLVTGMKTGVQYSSRKEIYKLAERLSGIDMTINDFDSLDNNGCQSVSVTINDKFLAPIIIELCLTPKKDFISHAEKVISKYADMETSENYLADFETFQNLIKDRYISDEFEYGIFDFDEDISEKCNEQWEEMSDEQRAEWWKNWLKEHDHIN